MSIEIRLTIDESDDKSKERVFSNTFVFSYANRKEKYEIMFVFFRLVSEQFLQLEKFLLLIPVG